MDVDCIIDGVDVGGIILNNTNMQRQEGDKAVFDGKQVSIDEFRKFRFARPVSIIRISSVVVELICRT